MAAAYLFHIIKNHPFIDGNKRTGLVSALIFLELNNIQFIAEENHIEEMVLNVAKGKVFKPEIAPWLEKNSIS